MKPGIPNIFALLVMLIFSLLMSNCSGTQPATSAVKKERTEPVFRELADILRQEPGVDIKGNSPNYSVTIRGKKTFMTSSDPLYVIDGIAVERQATQVIDFTLEEG